MYTHFSLSVQAASEYIQDPSKYKTYCVQYKDARYPIVGKITWLFETGTSIQIIFHDLATRAKIWQAQPA